MKKLVLLPVVAVAMSAATNALAAVTPPVDTSGFSLAPMLSTFTEMFTDNIPTIVAIGALGFAIGVVITMMRRAKSVAK